MSAQPFTRTNSRILKGSEMRVGGNMYMPIDIMIDDTTRSMIMNGMKIMKPMRNADSNSESTKAGMIGPLYGYPVLKWHVVSVGAVHELTRAPARVPRRLRAGRGAIARDFAFRGILTANKLPKYRDHGPGRVPKGTIRT